VFLADTNGNDVVNTIITALGGVTVAALGIANLRHARQINKAVNHVDADEPSLIDQVRNIGTRQETQGGQLNVVMVTQAAQGEAITEIRTKADAAHKSADAAQTSARTSENVIREFVAEQSALNGAGKTGKINRRKET
jgi:hypothetical protein